jgi:hypothetical protein
MDQHQHNSLTEQNWRAADMGCFPHMRLTAFQHGFDPRTLLMPWIITAAAMQGSSF